MSQPLALDPFDHMLRARGNPGSPSCDAVRPQVASEVFRRDSDTCRFCGFGPASRYGGDITLHHLDHDHGNDAPENLAVACLHCHGTHHASYWGDRGQARIVFLPEMDQASLNRLSRTLSVARHAPTFKIGDRTHGGIHAAMARGRIPALAALEARATAAREALGSNIPGVLFGCLARLPAPVDLSSFRIWMDIGPREGRDRNVAGFGAAEIGSLMGAGSPYHWLGVR